MLFRNGLWVLLCCTWPRRKINNKHPEHIYAFDTIMRVIKSTIRITPIHLDDDRGAENSRTCNNKSDGGRKNICLMCENFFPVPRRFFFSLCLRWKYHTIPLLGYWGRKFRFFPICNGWPVPLSSSSYALPKVAHLHFPTPSIYRISAVAAWEWTPVPWICWSFRS